MTAAEFTAAPPLAQIMLANRPGLAEHLAGQEAAMRSPRRDARDSVRRPRRVARVSR